MVFCVQVVMQVVVCAVSWCGDMVCGSVVEWMFPVVVSVSLVVPLVGVMSVVVVVLPCVL